MPNLLQRRWACPPKDWALLTGLPPSGPPPPGPPGTPGAFVHARSRVRFRALCLVRRRIGVLGMWWAGSRSGRRSGSRRARPTPPPPPSRRPDGRAPVRVRGSSLRADYSCCACPPGNCARWTRETQAAPAVMGWRWDSTRGPARGHGRLWSCWRCACPPIGVDGWAGSQSTRVRSPRGSPARRALPSRRRRGPISGLPE